MVHDTPIIVVPTHLHQLSCTRIMPKNRIARRGTGPIDRGGLPGGMGRDRNFGENFVRFRVEFL